MATVQFKSAEKVMEAFTNRGVEAWSIWVGKQYMFKGIGAEELQSHLDLLSEGNNVVYTLQVYEGITNASQIKSNTAHDGSFNFRLNAEGQGWPAGAPPWYYEKKMGLEKRIEELESRAIDANEENKDDTIGGILNSYLNDPAKLGQLVQVGRTLMGLPCSSSLTGMQPVQNATIGNVNPVNDDEKINRLAAAIDTLEKNDPDILAHLEKLARISVNNPPMFKTLINMLNNF